MSSRKVLAVIDSDPILRSACDRIQERRKMAEQKLDFIKKQIENAVKEMHDQNEHDEGLIEARLKEIGCLKTPVNKDTHHICIEHDEGAIYLHANDDGGGLPQFLAEILGGPRGPKGPRGRGPKGFH